MGAVISFLLIISMIGTASADPKWFGDDTKSPDGWTFYCKSDGKNEEEALSMARAECARKMCMLFGVEVKVEQKSVETLKDVDSKTTIIESCPLVRIVGRSEKKKLVDCEDESCDSFVSQFYPMNEYESEKKRLNNPVISPALEKTIIVREGNDTFKDPKKCKDSLKEYKGLADVSSESRTKRLALLSEAEKECGGLDYRNVDLQNELTGYLYQNAQGRGVFFASSVIQELSKIPLLIDKLKFMSELEKSDPVKSAATAQNLLLKNYDHLFFRTDHGPSYLEEIKSCHIHSKIVRAWPKALLDSISVCAPNKETNGKDCQSTSITMLRAAYAGCVCRNGAPEQESPCTQLLMAHMSESCPLEMTESCFQSMSKVVAEKMKLKLHSVK